MCEGYEPGDEFGGDDSEFDSVEERTVSSTRIPISFMGEHLELTPANTIVRLLSDDGLDDYSRVIVHLDDGSSTPFKPEGGFLQAMVRGGFPIEMPVQPDKTDQEFLEGYMRAWTEDATAELGFGA